MIIPANQKASGRTLRASACCGQRCCNECCNNGNWCCDDLGPCCDGDCCPQGQLCCDELTCYNPSTHKCCGYGNGELCPITEYCCSGTCCDHPCCGGICCAPNRCCNGTCCEPPNYCVDASYCTDCSTQEQDDCATWRNIGENEDCGCTVPFPQELDCSNELYFRKKVYTGNNTITCSSSYNDCSAPSYSTCYTEYECYTFTIMLFYTCLPAAGGGLACYGPDTMFSACKVCRRSGIIDVHYSSQSSCPPAEWP
jgi:hypothetical protein